MDVADISRVSKTAEGLDKSTTALNDASLAHQVDETTMKGKGNDISQKGDFVARNNIGDVKSAGPNYVEQDIATKPGDISADPSDTQKVNFGAQTIHDLDFKSMSFSGDSSADSRFDESANTSSSKSSSLPLDEKTVSTPSTKVDKPRQNASQIDGHGVFSFSKQKVNSENSYPSRPPHSRALGHVNAARPRRWSAPNNSEIGSLAPRKSPIRTPGPNGETHASNDKVRVRRVQGREYTHDHVTRSVNPSDRFVVNRKKTAFVKKETFAYGNAGGAAKVSRNPVATKATPFSRRTQKLEGTSPVNSSTRSYSSYDQILANRSGNKSSSNRNGIVENMGPKRRPIPWVR